MVNSYNINKNGIYDSSNVQDIRSNSSYNFSSLILNNKSKPDCFKYSISENNVSALKKQFDEIQTHQGLIGKAWNGIKKIFGGGSKKVEKAISQYENGEISFEQAQRILDKYNKGQKMSVDVAAEVISGIASVTAYNTTLPKDKVSIVAGLAASTLTGASVKTGIKYADAKVGKREYTSKDLAYDAATGAMNGIMGPVSNAIGAKTTEVLGNKFGLEVISDGVKAATKNATGIKGKIANILTTQRVDVKGGTLAKRAVALGVGMAIDGALSSASDNMLRAGFNGENVLKAGVQGAVGGAVAAPVLGGGFRLAASAGKKINNKLVTSRVLRDGMKTTFNQGETGDCSLLTIIDGLMHNPNAQNKIKNSITHSVGGDYFVQIGDTTVRVAKESITDEMLSDVTGIRIFEQAYKQVAGDLDGGFADVVAKQFGLSPVHITSDSITDDLLNTLAKQKDNNVLSLGLNVDDLGAISPTGQNRHYFAIRDIDTANRRVKLVNPYDTSTVIDMSFDDVTKTAISIDGGTVTKSSLPNVAREAGEIAFKGIDIDYKVKALNEFFNISCDKKFSFSDFLASSDISCKKYTVKDFAALLELNRISFDEISEFLEHSSATTTFNELFTEYGEDEAQKIISRLIQILEQKQIISRIDVLEPYHLSLSQLDDFLSASEVYDGSKMSKVLRSANPEVFEAMGGEKYINDNLTIVSNSQIPSELSMSPEHLIEIPSSGKQKRFFLFKNSPSIPHKQHHFDQKSWITLIKSNMITEDAIEIAQKKGLKFPATCKVNLKNNKGTIEYVTAELIEKAQREGYDKLSSFEIHALTDMLKNLYKGNEKILSSNTKLVSMADRIYDVVDFLRKSMPNSPTSNIEIGDHALLRMMDRNIANVVDNSTGNVIEYGNFIKLILENANDAIKKGKNEFVISGVEGSSGIRVLLKKEGSKFIIDSII